MKPPAKRIDAPAFRIFEAEESYSETEAKPAFRAAILTTIGLLHEQDESELCVSMFLVKDDAVALIALLSSFFGLK